MTATRRRLRGRRSVAVPVLPWGCCVRWCSPRTASSSTPTRASCDLEVGDQVLLPDRARRGHRHRAVATGVFRGGHRRLPVADRQGHRRRRAGQRGDAQGQGADVGGHPPAGPGARAADEGAGRGSAGAARPSSTTRRRNTVDFRSLLRDLSSTLEGPGRAPAGDRPGRGTGDRRHRFLRPGHLLLDVPARLRADHPGDGARPGPAAEPDADLRGLRPADVLPEVRAPDVSRLQGHRARRSASRSIRRSGAGIVVGHNVLDDSVVLKLAADGTKEVCKKASVCSARKAYDSRPR